MTRVLVVAAMAAYSLANLGAHHSFAAYYFEEQSVSISGEIVAFDYASPHAWVHVTASDPTGRAQQYAAEWANPSRLARDGITRDTLKPGDRVIITGSPGRKASEYKVHLKRIERPADGWSWRRGRGGRRR